jgi:hypothetical protein
MPTLKERLTQLGERIRLLKIEYDKFLNRAIPTPPDDFRAELYNELRALRAQPTTSFADNYLMGALEARLNSLSELYTRRLREAEMGLAPGRPSHLSTPHYDPYRGVVFGDEVSSDAAHALYRELYPSDERRARTDFSTFLHFLEQKASTIRNLTGCSEVQFRIDARDGRLALKAKAIQAG